MEQRDDWHLTEMLHNAQGRGDPFAAAVRATRMPMVITDPTQPDNPIVFVNEAFQRLTGYEREEIIGHNCRFLQGPETDRASVDKVRAAIEGGGPVDVDLLNYRKDGTSFWNALYLSPVRDDDGVIRFFFASQLDVTERVEAQTIIARQKELVEQEVQRRTAELEAAVSAKTVLLHEVDHRVKNNLNMIGSLLRLQTRTIADPAVQVTLNAMLDRLDALATVHRRLYQSDDVSRFDIGSFALTLARDMLGASGRADIVLQGEVEGIDVDASMASPLGLVLNEVMANAIKHAFADGRPGTLLLSTARDGTSASITVADDGAGMDGHAGAEPGLGTTLIRRLSKQAKASVEYRQLGPGTAVTVTFPSGR